MASIICQKEKRMKNKIVEYFSKLMPLSDSEKEAILEDLQLETYKKDTTLLREGQVPKVNYFVLEGCVRQYSIVEGEEKTLDFFLEEQWILLTNSSGEENPSKHYLTCVEDCSLVLGDEEGGDRLLKKFPNFQDLSRMVLEKQIMKQQQLSHSFITDSAEQRYKNVVKLRPELLARVPQYQLASYLGVTPESLSRIRKRIQK